MPAWVLTKIIELAVPYILEGVFDLIKDSLEDDPDSKELIKKIQKKEELSPEDIKRMHFERVKDRF
jgi:hypothetical protein